MKKGKVLVVDDEKKIRSLLELYLFKNDYVVLTASDGKTALQILKQDDPDVIVLDILLPDIHGLELCKKIRTYRNIPILYLSCLQETETIISGLECGGDDYLTKPFDPNVLVAKINALLRRTRNHQYKDSEVQALDYEPLTDQEKKFYVGLKKDIRTKKLRKN